MPGWPRCAGKTYTSINFIYRFDQVCRRAAECFSLSIAAILGDSSRLKEFQQYVSPYK
jgi:hypothetical protein